MPQECINCPLSTSPSLHDVDVMLKGEGLAKGLLYEDFPEGYILSDMRFGILSRTEETACDDYDGNGDKVSLGLSNFRAHDGANIELLRVKNKLFRDELKTLGKKASKVKGKRKLKKETKEILETKDAHMSLGVLRQWRDKIRPELLLAEGQESSGSRTWIYINEEGWYWALNTPEKGQKTERSDNIVTHLTDLPRT